MKAFSTFRDGNPPTPGMFATDDSVYGNGSTVQIGDLIVNTAQIDERGVVIGVYGGMIVYLVSQPGRESRAEVNDMFACNADDAVNVGQAHYPLREIAKLEAEADGVRGGV